MLDLAVLVQQGRAADGEPDRVPGRHVDTVDAVPDWLPRLEDVDGDALVLADGVPIPVERRERRVRRTQAEAFVLLEAEFLLRPVVGEYHSSVRVENSGRNRADREDTLANRRFGREAVWTPPSPLRPQVCSAPS